MIVILETIPDTRLSLRIKKCIADIVESTQVDIRCLVLKNNCFG